MQASRYYNALCCFMRLEWLVMNIIDLCPIPSPFINIGCESILHAIA